MQFLSTLFALCALLQKWKMWMHSNQRYFLCRLGNIIYSEIEIVLRQYLLFAHAAIYRRERARVKNKLSLQIFIFYLNFMLVFLFTTSYVPYLRFSVIRKAHVNSVNNSVCMREERNGCNKKIAHTDANLKHFCIL